MPSSIRILTAVPICDGHDSAINTINLEFIRHGIEVVYLGYHRYATDMVRAAIQEDVRALGISSYNGGHVEFFSKVAALLKKQGADYIKLFGGGGGTITTADEAIMRRKGVDKIFFAGTPLNEMVEYVHKHFGGARKRGGKAPTAEMKLARKLTEIEDAYAGGKKKPQTPKKKIRNPKSEIRNTKVFGFTGPGGAGKTTLIDEIILRLLNQQPKARIAILSHDPSVVGAGALLGDRATMINSQDERVFMRSMATRGQAGRLSPATVDWLQLLAHSDFDYVIIETVGTGQEAMPFQTSLVDKTVLVMNPDYGSRLQLQKIVMLDLADIVVVNKSDQERARTAISEVERRLDQNKRAQTTISTVANRHRDAGVDELCDLLMEREGRRAAPSARRQRYEQARTGGRSS